MRTRLKTEFIAHLRLNFILYIIVLFALLTGIAAGIFTAGSMSEPQRAGLVGYLQSFFESIGQGRMDKGAIFREALWQQLQTAFFLWLSGLFFIGLPFILFIAGLRGFFLGFTVGFFISQYRFGGFLFTLVCILPQSLLYLPALTGIAVLALEQSLKRLKSRRIAYTREQRIKAAAPYTTRILFLFLVMGAGALLEAYVLPVLFGLFRGIFQ